MTDEPLDIEMIGARLEGLEALIKKLARSPFPIASSEQIDKIGAALAKAQGEFVNPAKNREVSVQPKKRDDGSWPQPYTFSYSTLGAITDVVRKPLADNGIALMQPPVRTQEGLLVRTILLHESGQWMSSDLPALMKRDGGAQDQGSAISYARRYGVTAMLNIVADEDEDGNDADGNRVDSFDKKPARPQRKNAKDAPHDGFDPDLFARGFLAQVEKAKAGEIGSILDMNRTDLDRLPKGRRDELVQKANAKATDLTAEKNETPIQRLGNDLLKLVKAAKDRDALNEILVTREDDFNAIKTNSPKGYATLMDNVTKQDKFLAEAA